MLQKVIKRFPHFLSPGLRHFAVFFLCTALFLSAQEAWGADYWEYTWTGAVDTNWSEIANWVAVDPETRVLQTHTNPPNAHGDTAIIPAGRANYPVIPDGQNIELFKLFDNRTPGPGSITIESGGTVTIASGASVTCGKIEIQQGGTLINNGKLNSTTYYRSGVPAVRSGEAHIQNGGTFKNSGTVTVERFSAEYASTVPKGKVTGTGTFELGGTITTGAEQTYAGAVTLATDTTLTAGTADNITFDGTLDGAFSLTVSQAKDVTFTGAIGGSVPLKNIEVTTVSSITAGNVTLTGSWNNNSGKKAEVSSITFTGTGTSEIKGENEFTDFTCTTPGKMLSFENDKKQTITGAFTVIGTDANEITLASTSPGTHWQIAAVNHMVKYANVTDSQNTSGTIMICYNGTVPNSPNWQKQDLHTYYWNGSTGESWKDKKNWTVNGGEPLKPPQSFDDVIIPNPSPNPNPSLDVDATIASLTLADSASIDGAHSLTVRGTAAISGTIGNNTALASFTVGGKTTIGANGGSAVSINTNGAQTYKDNVDLNVATTFTAQDITVSGAVTMQTGNLTIDAVGAVIFNRDITGTTTTITLIQAASAVFNGSLSLATFTNQASATIVFNNSVRVTNTFTSNNADSITSHLSFYAKIFSGSGTNTSYTFKGTTISNVFSISSTGTVTLAGILQIDGTPVASPGFTFPGPVVLASRTEINSKNGTIRFSSTLNGASGSSYALTLDAGTTGDVFFNQDVGNTAPLADIAINTAKSVTAGKVTLSGSWNNNSGKEAKVDSITFTGTGISQIKGDNEFTNFTCTTPGKIISFPSTETSVNSFKVEGYASSYITLQGEGANSWSLSFTGTTGDITNPNLKFVSIKKAQLTGTSVFIYADKTRSSDYTPDSGNPSWTFDMRTLRTWEGSVSSTWGDAINWRENAVPGSNDNIFIPTVSSTNSQPTIPTGGVQVAEAEISGNVTGTSNLTITGDMVISGTAEISAPLAVTGTVTIKAPGKDVVLNNPANVFNGVVTVEQTKDISLTGTFKGGLEQKNGTGTTTLDQIALNSNGISIINNKLQITGRIQDAGFFFAQATDTTAPTIELGANVSATTSISFAGSVVLTTNSTLTAGSGGIIFKNVINSASTGTRELTVTTGSTTGDITFAGTIGEGTPLATLTAIGAGKININGGSVSTIGAQTYTGAAVFSQNTTLTADGIKFEGTVTQIGNDKILTLNSSNVVTQTNAIDADSLLLLGNGPFYLAPIGNNINTLAAGTGTGTIRFTAAKDLTVGTVDTTAGITREGLVIIDGGTNKLTISQPVASSGNIQLSTSTTSTTGSIALGANITATGSTASITLGVTTTLTSSVEVTSNDGTITFNKSINANSLGGQGLTITSKGITILNAPLGGTPLASFTKNGTGALQPGNNITTTGEQLYEGQVDLKVDTTFTTTNSDITFNSTIRSLDNNARSLTFQAGDGTVTFGGAVGDTSFPVSSLTKNGNGTTQINGGSVTTVGAQSYTGAVTIGITSASTPTPTTTLTTTNSKVTFNNAVNLNQNLKIDTGMGIGDIDFSGTNATINGTYNLEFLAGTGGITFGGTLGSESAPIGKFTVTSAGTVSINNAFFQTKTTTDDFIVTSGNIAVGANTFVAGNIVLNGGTFTQTGNNTSPSSNIHSVGNISLAGGTIMKWAAGTTETTGGSLTITGDTITAPNTNPIDFGYKSVLLNTDITLGNLIFYDLTIPSGKTVTLNNPITVRRNVTIEDGGSYSPDVHTLTLGGTGTVQGTIKDENDGTSNPKQNFGVIEIEQNATTKTFATDITAGTITISGGTNTGTVTFDGNLTVDTFTNTGGAFDLVFNGKSTIKTTTSSATINTTGTITFKKINTFSGGLSINSAPVNLGGSLAISQGNIIFPAPVTLLTATSFITISTGNGTITFNSTIDGTNDSQETLHLLPAGTGGVNFEGAVGGTNALKALTIRSDGPVTQTVAGIITANELSLEHSGTYTLDQNNKINKLSIKSGSNPDGPITFNNTKDLEVTGITREIDVSVTLTAGNLTFTTNPVNVTGANSKLIIDTSTGNGNIDFNSPLTAEELVFTAGAYSVALNNTDAHESTITKQVDFNTTGIVTLNTSSNDKLFLTNGLLFSAVPSKILVGGLIESSGVLTFNSAVETQSEVTEINLNDTNIIFESTIDNDNDTNTDNLFIDAGAGSVTFMDAVGATRPLESVYVHGNEIHINGGTVVTDGIHHYAGKVTIDNNDCTLPVKGDITFTDTITLKKNLSISTAASNTSVTFPKAIIGTTANTETLTVNAGTSNVIFGGAVGAEVTPLKSVTITANTAPINPDPTNTDPSGGVQIASDMNAADFVITTPSNVFISGASTFNIGGAGNTINFPANLFIAAGDGNTVSFNKDITAANSIALFSGDVSLGGNLTATTGDIVLLNGDSQTMFKSGTLEGLFGYNAQNMGGYSAARGHLTASVSIPVFPNTLPNNDPIDHTNYYGTVITSALAGKTLSVGQNFYANGVNLTATAPWTLKLKDNNSALNAFAEAYNMTITNSKVECLTTNGYAWLSAAENCTNGTGNTNIAFSRPQLLVNIDTKPTGEPLSGTYTIYDDVIRVEFVDSSSVPGTLVPTLIENTNNEISAALANIKFHNNAIAFTGSYTNPECTTSTDGAGDLSIFYLKTNSDADQRWNTDATGSKASATDSSDSTDRGRNGQHPKHRTIIPSIDIPTALDTLYQTLRDEHKNRIATVNFTQTADRCRPVVVEVRTGQEVHKPFASQAKYDAHNFIEIRYSEPVAIPQFSDPSLNEYVKSQDAFSPAAAGGAIKQNGTGLDISGFANLETGTLETGTNGVNDPTVHALYRNFTFDGTESVNPADSAQTHRVRISIAGWTDTKGATGYEYPGYIDNAVTPSGAVTVVANRNIKDLSAATTDGNPLEPTNDTDTADNTGYGLNRDTNHPKAAITVNNADSVLYGSWDIAPPVVSRFDWYDEKNGYEIVGNSNAAGYVGNFEFHFFDNTPDYPKTPPGGTTWLYSRGWGDLSNPIRPDTVGGSRPEYMKNPTLPQTQGGLRAATITANTVKNAFLLHLAEQKSNIGFDGTFERFITLNNFFGDETQPLSVTDDTLYLSLKPARTDLRSRETYDVVYDSSKGYITDLAGNRLKSAIWRTIDRTPPKISMTVTPYDDTRLLVFFNKKIELDPLPAAQNAVLSNIHQEFLFFNKFIDPALDPDASLAISDLRATKAELVFHTEDATGLILTLSRKVSYTELSTAFISLKKHTDLQDITGPVPAASNITDKKYNWMNWNDRIPITYFGVNTIKPLYATDGMVQTGGDKKEGTTVVIRGDFDGSGQLYYDREISMQVRLADGVMPQTVPDVFIDAKPNLDSVSVTFNKNSGKNLSFWLPNLPDFPYQLISPSMNTHAVKLATGTGSGQVYTFKIPVNSPEREPGDTLQFIFRHGEIMTPDRITGQLIVPTPFYHIRLNNAQDPSELSLFAFSVLSMLRQRGGSTILNNVIQAGSEEAVLEVIMPKQGNLTVSVMTLDGNVIKHLHHGTASAGTHYLRWNGTNASGRSVARGMYFVRIIGPNIDETRKIMVVKD